MDAVGSTAPRGPAAGVALETCAVADRGKVAAFGAGFAEIAFHPRFGPHCRRLRGLLPNLDIVRLARRLWDRQPILPHALEMKFDGFADFYFHVFRRIADGNATGQIRNIRGVVSLALLDHDSVTHGSVLKAGLPKNALQRAGLQIGAQLAGHGDAAFLDNMLELAVTAFRRREGPSVVLKTTDDFPDGRRHGVMNTPSCRRRCRT
jgi:hypothetical protein